MLVDSHCHLDFDDFAGDLDAVMARARAAGIGGFVTISLRVAEAARVLAVAERFDDVFCSVGIHPHHAHEEPDVTVAPLVSLAARPRVVANGSGSCRRSGRAQAEMMAGKPTGVGETDLVSKEG